MDSGKILDTLRHMAMELRQARGVTLEQRHRTVRLLTDRMVPTDGESEDGTSFGLDEWDGVVMDIKAHTCTLIAYLTGVGGKALGVEGNMVARSSKAMR
jgi:hypothetical protein